ncbi:uncharacterized protein MONOS_17726 [Monocercomonoides exilis]|uniref:uncharacterized protein n=1 Tax=Monocercomonoides exilis TaxID=2049356 RepID=UPI003559C027|nr:hypothetical protein MONOS_17726 [Monocercomonoides exilis]
MALAQKKQEQKKMNASYEETVEWLSTAMERLMSAVSEMQWWVAYETAYVLRLPPKWRSSVPMQMPLMLLKTGLKQKLAWTLSKIQGIYRD